MLWEILHSEVFDSDVVTNGIVIECLSDPCRVAQVLRVRPGPSRSDPSHVGAGQYRSWMRGRCGSRVLRPSKYVEA